MDLVRILPFFLVLFTVNVACSETPSAPVEVVEGANKDNTPTANETNALKAVTYSGSIYRFNPTTGAKIKTNQACTMQVSLLEENGRHHVVAQLAEQVHGINVPAMELDPYYFNEEDGLFYKTPTGTAIPNLMAAKITLQDEPDMNKLFEYELNNQLRQSMQLTFTADANLEAIEETLESLQSSPVMALGTEDMNALAPLEESLVQVYHIGHIDPRLCGDFTLATEASMISFEFEDHDHDDEDDGHDHDHDHGHDDDHGHDHG